MREQLELARQRFEQKLPAETSEVILDLVRKQELDREGFGIRKGSRAADFALADPLGGTVTLYEELNKGPVVLAFYRGGWCPFCNVQLRAYQRILPEIERLGAQLIAVSPQSPDNSLSQREKEALTFRVLSDPDGRAAFRYNLLFEIPERLRDVYLNRIGLDLGRYNRSDLWALPVPATFVLGRDGIVREAFVDPDFMKRMEPEAILRALETL